MLLDRSGKNGPEDSQGTYLFSSVTQQVEISQEKWNKTSTQCTRDRGETIWTNVGGIRWWKDGGLIDGQSLETYFSEINGHILLCAHERRVRFEGGLSWFFPREGERLVSRFWAESKRRRLWYVYRREYRRAEGSVLGRWRFWGGVRIGRKLQLLINIYL